jgi:hypothetical protein
MNARRGRLTIAVLAACAAVAAPAQAAQPAGKPVAVPKAAKLAITVDSAPPLRRNRWARVRVEVANVGGKAAKRVTLQARPGRGATVAKRTLRLGTIAPGKQRTTGNPPRWRPTAAR